MPDYNFPNINQMLPKIATDQMLRQDCWVPPLPPSVSRSYTAPAHHYKGKKCFPCQLSSLSFVCSSAAQPRQSK